jgi:cytochrome c553
MKSIAAISLAGLLLVGASATAGTSKPSEPNIVTDTCSQCHGNNGISSTAWFPNLAGQTKTYLETQLKDFQNHTRADHYAKAYMWNMAGTLPDQVINKIAEYYKAQKPPKGSTTENPTEVAAGEAIFKNGITSENVPACGACHGANAEGNSMFPRLAGQHREYLVAQLEAFRDKSRNNAIMYANVQHMTDAQMRVVAAYLASL